MSTQAAKPQEERVQSLRLNMLEDNPGAVKKVRFMVAYFGFIELHNLGSIVMFRFSRIVLIFYSFFSFFLLETPYRSRYRFQQGKD
jgi:hypothetical protein